MPQYYHGTTLHEAYEIAKIQRIKSPWYKQIAQLEKICANRPDIRATLQPDIKAAALKMTSLSYTTKELEHRVKSISLSTNFSLAQSYTRNNGAILGFELDPSKMAGTRVYHDILFVQGEISLEKLKQVYFNQITLVSKKIADLLRNYSEVKYFILQPDGNHTDISLQLK